MYTFFSHLESDILRIYDHMDGVTDIKEQFPTPLPETLSLYIERIKQNHYKWNNLISDIYDLFNLFSRNTYDLQDRALVVLIVLINHSQNNLLEAAHFVWVFITFIDLYSISISSDYNSLL